MNDKYYDSIAQGYDELYGEEQEKKFALVKSLMEISNNTRILDLGCGTGISCNFDCYCIGVDPSLKLIGIARKKDGNSKHEYIVAKSEDIATLGFKDWEFDYVISLSAVHHFENVDRILDEIKRIGKKYIFTVLKKSRKKEEILKSIKAKFKIIKEIEEEKDIIVFFRSSK